MSITTVNPASGAELATYDSHSDEDLERLLQDASVATAAWGTTNLEDRVEVVRNLATTLRQRCEELAALITQEMGKARAEAAGEIEVRQDRRLLRRRRR